jgi:RNA polymerase sigma-70 factor, ECF subfamily
LNLLEATTSNNLEAHLTKGALNMRNSLNHDQVAEFELIYTKYHKLVRRSLYKLCPYDNLDDLVQEVFLKIWKSLPKVREQSNVTAWINRIAYYTAIDHFRKHKRKFLDLDENRVADKSYEQTRTHRNLLQYGLKKLDHNHRTPLVMHSLEGFSLKEIAAALSLPEGTIKSRLHHARQKMFMHLRSEAVVA